MVDAGNALHRSRQWPATGLPQARATASVLAQGLAASGLDAMALGAQDWWLGTQHVLSLAHSTQLPILAANLVCDDESPFPGGVVIERSGRRIGIVGITVGEPQGCRVDEPQRLAEAALLQLGPVDLSVLLAPLSDTELQAWGQRGSPFDLVVSGGADIPSTTAAPWSDGWRVQSGSRGKQVGVARLGFVAQSDGLARVGHSGDAVAAGHHTISVSLTPLAQALAERADIAAIVEQGKLRIAAAEAAPARPIDASARRVAAGSAFAGRDTCVGCHSQQDSQWQSTPHAYAWTGLDVDGRGLDRSCVGCHVTGWEQPGGPSEPAQMGPFRDVQCEACHGPAAAHVADPQAIKPVKTPPMSTCRGCHDGERDGGRFDEAVYWPAVVH